MNTGEMAALGAITETLAGNMLWAGQPNGAWCAEVEGPEGEAQVLTIWPDGSLTLQDWLMARGQIVRTLRAAIGKVAAV